MSLEDSGLQSNLAMWPWAGECISLSVRRAAGLHGEGTAEPPCALSSECVLPHGALGAVLSTVTARGGAAGGPGLSHCPQGGVVLVPPGHRSLGHVRVSFTSE